MRTIKPVIINLVAMAILLSLIFSAVYYGLKSYTLHGESLEVSNYEGFLLSELDGLFSSDRLNYEIIDSVYSSKHEPGAVISQDPLPESLVKPGRKIYLTVNAMTPPSVTMPELRDMTLRQAVSRIRSYGLEVDTMIYRPAMCEKCVIDMMYKGKKLEKGRKLDKGAKVTLIVGAGQSMEKIQIPQLYGMRKDEVTLKLTELGLLEGFVTYDETIETAEDSANAVLFRQSPKPMRGEYIHLGQSIDLNFTTDSTLVPALDSNIYQIDPSL